MQCEAKERRTERRGHLTRMTCVLLALTVIFVCCFVAGVGARFSTEVTSGDGARVAKFSIKDNGTLTQPIEAVFAPGESAKTVELQIENDSEVAVEYSITVTNETNNLPLGFSLQKEGGTSVPSVNSEGSLELTNQPIPNKYKDKYTLTIEWKKDSPATPGSGTSNPADTLAYNDPARMGMVDHVAITVVATQID